MRGLILTVLMGITAFTTGCPQEPSKKFPAKTFPGATNVTNASNSKSLVTNINSYLATAQQEFKTAMDADPADVLGKAQRIRNDAIDDVLAVIDDNYNDYISHIEERRSRTDFVLDIVDLGAGAATGITKGERPNQILGIAMTAFRGGRRSSDLNFYKQQTTSILINKMDDNRATALADILNNRSTPAGDYSMKTAIRDLVDYYNSGTLVRAFAQLTKATGAQALASQAQVRRIKGPVNKASIPSLDLAQVEVQLDRQKQGLARAIDAGEKATPPALQPVRLKLEAIWNTILSNDKFKPAIATLKTDPAKTAILTNIESAPANVNERQYLRALFWLQTALNKDLALNQELLDILMTTNP